MGRRSGWEGRPHPAPRGGADLPMNGEVIQLGGILGGVSTVDLVIFGASGDLSRRKILPSLKHLAARNGAALRVIGAGRSDQSQQEFRDIVNESSGSTELASRAEWVRLNYRDPASFAPVKQLLDGASSAIFYLAT